MKTVTKELNLLDIEDIEEALCSYWGKPVSIADVECTLWYHTNIKDNHLPACMALEFVEGENWVFSDDIFTIDHTWKGKALSLSEVWLPAEEIFAFDVDAFKSFNIDVEPMD